jgi:hypothetical protein
MPSALNEYAGALPALGVPIRLNTIRSMVYASVAVPRVERAFAPIRSWSTTMAALRLCSASTSGRLGLPMNDCRNAE